MSPPITPPATRPALVLEFEAALIGAADEAEVDFSDTFAVDVGATEVAVLGVEAVGLGGLKEVIEWADTDEAMDVATAISNEVSCGF